MLAQWFWLGPLYPCVHFCSWSFITFHHEIKLTTPPPQILNTRRMFRMSCWRVLKLIWKFPKMHIWLLDNISIPVSSPRLVQLVGGSNVGSDWNSPLYCITLALEGRITKPQWDWEVPACWQHVAVAARLVSLPIPPNMLILSIV